MAKTVQIPETLFTRIYDYFINGRRESVNEEIICNGLKEKKGHMQARVEYAKKLNSRREAAADNE